MKHPDIMEFGLIGVRKKYRNSGLSWAPMVMLVDRLRSGKVKYCETNLTLEDNYNIINMLNHLKVRDHRRVRTYIRKVQ